MSDIREWMTDNKLKCNDDIATQHHTAKMDLEVQEGNVRIKPSKSGRNIIVDPTMTACRMDIIPHVTSSLCFNIN